MDQWSRRIIGFDVHKGDVDGISVCQMFNQAISGSDPPKSLSTDNDPLFKSHRWQANLRILDVSEIKSIPYAPISHPFIERVIGTIRREYLDHTPFWNSLDLARKLDDSAATTTPIELMLRCQDGRQRDLANQPNKMLRTSTIMVGSGIVEAYFKHRFQRNYQFAMYTHWMKYKIGDWEVVFRREQLQFVESRNAPAPKFAPAKPAPRANTANLYEMPG